MSAATLAQGVASPPRVLFAFDRVVHYHVPLLQRLETRLAQSGVRLHLAAGHAESPQRGRAAVAQRVLEREQRYAFHETVVAGWTLRRAPALPSLVRALAPRVVVCMAHVGHLAHWALLRQRDRMGFRLVAWQCGYEYHDHPLKAALLRRFVPRFDHHLAYHSRAAAYARRHGAAPERVTVMHNTLDESRLRIVPREAARRALEARHPALAGRRIVLFVGALLPEKRLEALAQAIALLGRADVALMVVGDGPHRAALQRALQARTDVLWAGAVVDGVGVYFDAADLYVLPGTGGLGLNEALAHGLPVVSGDADGSADDLVVDGRTGWRWRDHDPATLAALIARVLDDPPTAQRLGAAGRALVTGPYAFERLVERVSGVLLEQLRSVTSPAPPAPPRGPWGLAR